MAALLADLGAVHVGLGQLTRLECRPLVRSRARHAFQSLSSHPFARLGSRGAALVHVHLNYLEQFSLVSPVATLLSRIFYVPLIAAPWMVGKLAGRLDRDPPRRRCRPPFLGI